MILWSSDPFHDLSPGVLLFSELGIQRHFVSKSCFLIFLVFTSLSQMIDLPFSLSSIHSTFPPTVRTLPWALRSCQAIKKESAAASSTTDLTGTCGQQSQPPLIGYKAEISGAGKHLIHLSSCLGRCGSCSVCAQPISVSPSSAGSTKPPWRGCQGQQLAASFPASLRAANLVGFTYGKWFCRHGLYLASFCLCSIKSLEQDKFIVSFPLLWNLAANASQIPHSEHSSCLTMCFAISSWSSL